MTNERIAEIRAMLEGISPAPWAETPGRVVVNAGDLIVAHVMWASDNAIIAAAPTVIAELLTEVETWRKFAADYGLRPVPDEIYEMLRNK